MHHQPSPPAWGTHAHTVQRFVLLELALNPPPGGDDVDDLARVLEFTPAEVEAALDVLEAAGLAERRNSLAYATYVVRYVEALLPLRSADLGFG